MKSRTVMAVLVVAVFGFVGLSVSTAQARQRHPRIQRAMKILHRAENVLNRAAHDYNGHRAAAIQDINQALSELQTCMQMNNSKDHNANNNANNNAANGNPNQ